MLQIFWGLNRILVSIDFVTAKKKMSNKICFRLTFGLSSVFFIMLFPALDLVDIKFKNIFTNYFPTFSKSLLKVQENL